MLLSGLSLSTVLAFVNRLEELGNDAANRGDIRGSVVGFKTQDFAAALDITPEEAGRLFAALEHPDIGWLADGMIADFHDRNPDIDDPTAAERKRRERARTKIMRKLGDLARIGQITSGERAEIENNLRGLNHQQLVELMIDLEARSVRLTVTRDARMSQRDSVTQLSNPIAIPPSVKTEAPNVTCDNVTVTRDQNRDYRLAESAARLTGASIEPVGLAVEEERVLAVVQPDPSTWLLQEGAKLIMDRMGEPYERAVSRLSAWSAQVDDSAVLASILQGAQHRTGHGFHVEVTDQIRRQAH
ncbi:MAG: hypothetical protein Q8L63_04205 [Alphaproteobacteria bacterium]|nr:hypothetical protein [Alphaproteobacteria bacterium]